MAIITLTTDLGLRDYYVSSIKASILKGSPAARIIDITHDIARFDIMQAAFVLRNVMDEFPAGTIHIIGVSPEATPESPHVAIRHNNQFFIGADNGVFSLLFDDDPEEITEISMKIIQQGETQFITFPTKEVFVKVACLIAEKGGIQDLGDKRDQVMKRGMNIPVSNQDSIGGIVIYIDSYGNVITNITRQLFDQTGKGRKFNISFIMESYSINTISQTYQDVSENERLALFGTSGFLEIAINKGDARKLLGLHLRDKIKIEFID